MKILKQQLQEEINELIQCCGLSVTDSLGTDVTEGLLHWMEKGIKKWLEQKRQENLAVLYEKRYANGDAGKQFYRGRVYEDEQLLAELQEDVEQ